MLSIVKSMSLQGLEGILIDVEVDISSGMPCWDVVGLPDTNIKESKEIYHQQILEKMELFLI